MRLEKQLIQAVNRPLPKTIHHQSMTSASMTHNGTPDQYYDGGSEVWVEYKLLKAMPRSGIVVGNVSPIQLTWLERRYNNAIRLAHTPNVFVVVGLPIRTAVIQRTPTEWREGTPLAHAVPIKEVTEWLIATSSGSQLAAQSAA